VTVGSAPLRRGSARAITRTEPPAPTGSPRRAPLCRLRPVASDPTDLDDLPPVAELAAVVAQFVRRQDDLTTLVESLLARRPNYSANWIGLLSFVTHAGHCLAESSGFHFGNQDVGPSSMDELWGYLDLQLRRVVDKKPIDPHVVATPVEMGPEAREFLNFALGCIDSERGSFNRNLEA
jgi:hypothetical protein